jgi:micrococcal nuclease
VELGGPVIVESPSATTPAALTPGPSFGPPPGTQFATVTRIVDGDTIRVDINGKEYPVRYIGIDAPEPNATDPEVKKLADAATRINATLVEGQGVFLERDVSETDRFDRLLRNVWLVDSGGSKVLVNLELVRLGYAKVTTFPPDEKYAGYLTTAEASAKADQLGLWAPGSAPASTSSPAAQATANTLVAASDTGGSDCHPSYTPCLPVVGDLDCADGRAMGKDPVRVKGPDEYRLDSDKDGLGCE